MALALTRVGVVHNPRSHGNRSSDAAAAPPGVAWAEPHSPAELSQTLARFAAEGVELLVIDGGDGTVREVLSALPAAFGAVPPVLAILPSGKTNILALDLGAPAGWSLQAALTRAAEPTLKTRAPLEVSWACGSRPPVRGFFLGLGAFVRATEMSQSVHRIGAFYNLAVALTLAGAIFGTIAGGRANQWRRGEQASLSLDGAAPQAGARFLTLVTTLKRLPLGLTPFGPPREGMKVLDIAAPPQRLFAALPALLRGRETPWMAAAGYRRGEAERIALSLRDPIVIDGEVFVGGQIVVARGAPMRFLAP